MSVSELATRGLLFLQLARATSQVYIAVQNVQDTLAYIIHEFFVSLRDDSFRKFRYVRLEHLESNNLISHALSPISQ